jgi:hypothetical protein
VSIFVPSSLTGWIMNGRCVEGTEAAVQFVPSSLTGWIMNGRYVEDTAAVQFAIFEMTLAVSIRVLCRD